MDAKEETAMNGTWKKGPGTELFAALERVGNAPCASFNGMQRMGCTYET